MSEAEPTVSIRIIARGEWKRVVAEYGARDVSHLSYAPKPMRLGPAATLRMAGIVGVGTEPEQRRAGLARRVFAAAMEDLRASGYSCAGLYTETNLVAHRLYRRFGFVDTLVTTAAVKLVDPAQYVVARLAERLRAHPDLETWRCLLQLDLPPYFPDGPLTLLLAGGEVSVLTRPPKQVDLAVSMRALTFFALCRNLLTMEFAEASRQVQWQGEEAHWRRLASAFAT